MKQELFIKLLEQYAELRYNREAVKSGEQTARTPSEIIQRQGEQLEISSGDNPTWNIRIKLLKPIIKTCDDCGVEVEDRRVSTTLHSFPKRHWRKNCHGCRRTQDPDTKEFSISTPQAQAYFTAYLKNRNK
jgi:hypothetical protein